MNIIKLKKKQANILKRIRQIGPFLAGSLCATNKRCGNPKCRCASQGPIHETMLLTWKENGITQTLYVPKELREQVEKLVEQYSSLRDHMKQMSRTQREILAYNKGAQRAAGRKKPPRRKV